MGRSSYVNVVPTMRGTMRRFVPFAFVLLVAGACSQSPSAQYSAAASAAASAQVGAAGAACTSLKAFKSSLVVFRSLDPATTPKDAYKAAVNGVTGAWAAVQNNVANLGSANADVVQTAWRNFNQALQSQP